MSHRYIGTSYDFEPPLQSSNPELAEALVEHFVIERFGSANHVMAKFVREQVTAGLEHTAQIAGHDSAAMCAGLGTLTQRHVSVVGN